MVKPLIFLMMMMAAHDTRTSALTTMVYGLVRHPHGQPQLRQDALALPQTHLGYADPAGRVSG